MLPIIKILIILHIPIKGGLSETQTCPDNFDEKNNVVWPQTTTRILSKPICLNENREFVFRKCLDGQWASTPNCAYLQFDELLQCPENFTETEDLCYQFAPKSTFPPKCPFDNVVPFFSYIKVIGDLQEPIWVPAQRHGLNFVKWIEPSWLYRQDMPSYFFTKPLKEKECLIYHENKYILVSCNDTYRGVCAYRKLDQITFNLCRFDSPCYQSDFDVRSKCFCTGLFNEFSHYPKAEFINSYQYNLYKKLTNETCAIGLVKNESGEYVWTQSRTEIAYTYWSKDANFSKDLVFGAGTPNGWILTATPKYCYIYQKDINYAKPKLVLEFNETRNVFFLNVMNPQSLKALDSVILLFCFANTDGVKLSHIYTPRLVAGNYGKTFLYQFEPIKNISGYYWCEAFDHVDSSIIRSNEYFIRPDDYLEFVGIFEIPYDSNLNPLSPDIYEIVKKSSIYQNTSSFFRNIRIMKITDLDENKTTVSVNIHFTANPKLESNSEDFFYIAKHYVSTTLSKQSQTKMLDFLSSDYCFLEVGFLTWFTSSLGSITNPQEYCFTKDGNLVSRLCDGNFMDGARWAEYEHCEFYKNSLVTRKLLTLVKNFSLDEIYEVSKSYQHFYALDVYLIGKMCSEYLSVSDIDVFSKIVSNLLKIDKRVLKEAQTKLKATDKILHFIDNINVRYQDTFEFQSNNFVYVSLKSESLSGLAIIKNSKGFEIKKLSNDYTFNKVSTIKNLEAAIWVSPQFQKAFPEDDRITFSIYFQNSFFLQDSYLRTSIIFGLTNFENPFFNGPIHVIYKKQDSSVAGNKFCAFWGYSLNHQGSWKKTQIPIEQSSFLICNFWYSANFAIVTSDYNHKIDSQLTNNLKTLLQSNTSVLETLSELSQITEKYIDFEPVDLSVVGQILQKVSDVEAELNFTFLAQTISNIQQVDRKILTQSQMEEAATDIILAHVDSIIKKHNFGNITQVVADNFILVTFDSDKNVTGVALMNVEEMLEPVLLDFNRPIDEVIKSENFDSAVVLSPKLQKQFPKDSEIIITIYFTDSLFNQKSPKPKIVNTIFGVVLPECKNFSSPVSIFYKRNEFNLREECSYWHFDRFTNVTGFWKNDGDYRNYSNITQCDFWHTTHFTYLIVDALEGRSSLVDILTLVTSINCIISLISLISIVLTGVLFKQWRENTGNQIILNYTFAIILQIVIFYISNLKDYVTNYFFCTIIGIILHYSIVSQFCWMFVIAILQFRRFVTVFDGPPKFILLKSCVCGWGLPLLPVISVFALDQDNYVKSKVGLCYPSDLGLYLGVWLPISIIIFINFILFSITLYNVVHKKTECVIGNGEGLYQWRLAVLLFFMLGFNWCFGFLAQLEFGLTFEYLFCITTTLQGFILFLFFIICNSNTRYLYVTALGKYFKRKFK